MAAISPAVSRGSLASALTRLTQKAHREGLLILDDGFAPYACRVSSARGEAPYLVVIAPDTSGHGRDCPGYEKHQRCKHYALCLEAAGWLPEVDPPDDPPPAAPISALPRADRRALAAADLAARYPSRHPARAEDLEAA